MEENRGEEEAVEEHPEESGAEGDTGSESYDSPPGAPGDDESAAGDTDQHTESGPDTWQGGA